MDKLLVSVSQTAVTQAEHAIEACQRCSPQASVAFSLVLHSFRTYGTEQVEFILPVLAHCPRCWGEIDESTLVKLKHSRAARQHP
jgi:hypothetical protein